MDSHELMVRKRVGQKMEHVSACLECDPEAMETASLKLIDRLIERCIEDLYDARAEMEEYVLDRDDSDC